MNKNRRKFLKLTGSVTAGIALSGMPGLSLLSCTEKAKDKVFGIQLYTLRDEMPKDPKGVLKQLADFGYKQIESYEGPQGIFWGMSHTDYKKYLDDLGLTALSAHTDINKDFEQKAEQASAIGMKYLLSPWLGPQPTIDDYKKAADEFNKRGEICKKHGIRFAYHNHDYTFVPIDGVFPQDVLMQNTDPSLVDYQLDMYWIVTAKQDPEAWLRKYKDRFRLCHVKDRLKDTDEKGASCDLGKGMIDYPKILKTAKDNGMTYFVVEQERYDNSTPIKSSQANAEYMKKLDI